MKVRGGRPTESALKRFRGVLHIYEHKDYGVIARKWPRKRGPSGTPAQLAARADFRDVIGWCSEPLNFEIDAAAAATFNTLYMPRDLMEASCYGMPVVAYLKDGRVLRSARMAAQDIDALLDSITANIGDMLVRTSTGWHALSPNTAGYVLTDQGTGIPPQFAPNSGGGAGTDYTLIHANYSGSGTESAAFSTKGAICNFLNQGTVAAVGIGMPSLANGGSYVARFASLNASNVVQQVVSSGTFVSSSTLGAFPTLALNTTMVVNPGTKYAACISRIDNGNTFALPLFAFNAGQVPFMPYTQGLQLQARIASTTIAIGNTIDVSLTRPASMIGLLFKAT
jgi:hypothetical protein